MVNRKEDFRIVLREWKEKKLPEIVEREIKIPLELSQIAAIIGPRRAGKTYQMFSIIKALIEKGISKENILYVNFEHERLSNLKAEDLREMIEVYYELFRPEGKVYLFLDEIQRVDNWESWIRRIHESKEYHIYISGSSSKLLSKEIATQLRGRSIDFIIFPFSFREFLRAKKFEVDDINSFRYSEKFGKLLALLKEYLELGAYPEVVLEKDDEIDDEIKVKILRSYYNAIFYRDLVDRFGIENLSLLDTFLKHCLKNVAKYFSISKTYNYFKGIGYKCSKQTLLDYFEFSKNVFFLFPVEIFSYSLKEKKQYPRKMYVVDNGIVTAIYPEIKGEIGKLMENVVAIELLRRSELNEKFEVYYWKEYGKMNEVDFVLKEGLKIKQLIQVTYASSKDEIEKREIKSLLKASELLKCKDLLIITWDYEDEIKANNKTIKCLPLWKWLIV
jgi:predicted AAA+ superfamily ATPase